MLNKSGKFRNEFGLILIVFLIASVTALQGTSLNYTLNSKFDFGAAGNASSSSYVGEFIFGFEAVGDYQSSSYTGKFGILENVSPPIIPTITITSPVDGTTYDVNSVDLNWSSDEELNWCDYQLNGAKGDELICEKELNWVSTLQDDSLDTGYLLEVSGDYLYVASYSTNNLTIVDISDRKNPSIAGAFGNSDICDEPWGFSVSGDTAYMSCDNTDDLVAINVSNATNPTYIGNFTNWSSLDTVYDLVVEGDYAYFVDQSYDFFVIVDVSDPTDMVQTGVFENSTSLVWVNNLFIEGDYAYILSEYTTSITILDISDKTNPSQVGYFSNTTSMNGYGYDSFDFFVKNDYIYIATYNSSFVDSLTIINATNKTNPHQVGNVIDSPNIASVTSVYVYGDYAYVSSNGGNINYSIGMFDISDKTSPLFVGYFQNGSTTSSIFYGIAEVNAQSDYIYSLSEGHNSISIFNSSIITNNVTLTNLNDDNYELRVRVKDLDNNYVESSLISFTIDRPLFVEDISINSTDGSNKTAQDLHCSANILDDDGDDMNVTVRWYNGSGLALTQNYNDNYANGTYFVGDLDSSYTTKGQDWSCGMRVFDGIYYSSWSYSDNLTILNTLPVVTLNTPADGSLTTNITPTFTWNATDDDGDSLTYDFNISLVASSLCTDSDQYVQDLSSATYTVSRLNCYFDNEDYYVWSARAKDNEDTGDFASYFNINLSSYIAISLPVDSVSFGSVAYLGSNNTTDNSPSPFVIQNDGNSLINVNISATDLWLIVSNPTEYYKLKVDNVSGEEGAFNWTGSNTNWINVSTTNNTIFINKLNYSDATDSAEVDVYVEVPENETPVSKSSTVYFISSFAG